MTRTELRSITKILTNYIRYGIVPADDMYHSGPGLVTPGNAQQIEKLTAQNYR